MHKIFHPRNLFIFLLIALFGLYPPQLLAQGLSGVINLNTATAAELQRLPGIGPKKAKKIIQYRQRHPFKHWRQLRQVKGIGPKGLKTLKPYIATEGLTTLRKRIRKSKHTLLY